MQQLKKQIRDLSAGASSNNENNSKKDKLIDNLKHQLDVANEKISKLLLERKKLQTQVGKIEEELKSVFYQLEEANTQFDNDKAAQFISEYKDIIPKVIGVELENRDPLSKPTQYIKYCPACNVRLIKEERDAKAAKKYLGNARVVWSNGTFPEAPKQGAPAPALKAAAVEVKDDLPF